MEKNKTKTLGIAGILIVLCIALLIGGTYALFSDRIEVENHLQAGTLKIKLERTSLTKTCLDETTGYLNTLTNTSTVDFTNQTTENVFGIGTNELVVPGSSYEAQMKITNNGSVAFTYDIKLSLLSVQTNALASQMKVYIDGVDKGYLSQLAQANSQVIIATGTMTKADVAKTFTIKIVFENLSTNNDAQNQDVSFDLIVAATQKTR